MLKVNEYGDIKVTHGDTANIVFTLSDNNFSEWDKAVFAVKEKIIKDSTPLLLKEVFLTAGSNSFVLKLEKQDFNSLEYKTYFYDLRIVGVNGITTPNPPRKFTVLVAVADV